MLDSGHSGNSAAPAGVERLPLRSFFMAGFECSSHRRADGRRLDLLASTQHDCLARQDYASVQWYGLGTVRDGIRWHLVEAQSGRYNWESWLPMLRAARETSVQVIWDLCHYGWPDHLDIWSASFVDHFAAYARAAARIIQDTSGEVPWYCPVNEMSYWAWAGGQVGRMNPCTMGRGDELKRQLVRAYLAGVAAIREVDPRARFIVSEPLIHVVADTDDPVTVRAAEEYRLSQFQTNDMIVGNLNPHLGGRADYLDVIGLNYYFHNQWTASGRTIPFGHHAYRAPRLMIAEVFERYRRSLLISETGAEGLAGPCWLNHVCTEAAHAMEVGIPIAGICWYPILNYPGWDDDRLCKVGLLSEPDDSHTRRVAHELAGELQRQQALLQSNFAARIPPVSRP
jgi:hypothetical protein